MNYRSLRDCVSDLEKHGDLLRIPQEVDPYLQMAEIHCRVHAAGGPAVFFERVKGSPFPAVSNLFGTLERARFLFRRTLGRLKNIFELKAEPSRVFRAPVRYVKAAGLAGWQAWPQKVSSGPVLECTTTFDQLPQIQCWPRDGGGFILLPQVYTEDPARPGILHSNLGMYRIQMSGNQYLPGREAGLHYQIRRDIGIHHAKALLRQEPLRVSIFVGGPPAHSFAAAMYLPEDMPEVALAGVLGGRRFRYAIRDGFVISVDADFCITGWVDPSRTKPEGPFGDHLGYYSLTHPFPYLKVEKVYHRKEAIWPFTVVGRPPQEDSVIGRLVQELGGIVIPRELPGIRAIHAVDACGIHPLLLAIGSERDAPFQAKRPRELLRLANALLGYGPCSLAKYVWIANGDDNPDLDVRHIEMFFQHMLERVDWARDLHFETETTLDTLDYSGMGLNRGSKLVLAATGRPRRRLGAALPESLHFPRGFGNARLVLPGVVALQAPRFQDRTSAEAAIQALKGSLGKQKHLEEYPFWVLVDDSNFAAKNLQNFLWVAFTRSNPSHDIDGVGSFMEHKHWGCRGPLILDARIKPHHTPTLEQSGSVVRSVDALAAPGQCLHGIISSVSGGI